MTSTEPLELSLKGDLKSGLKSDLGKLAGKLGGLFNPALHPRGYHGRFTYTGGRDLKKAEAAARKAARHEGHLDRVAARKSSGGGRSIGRRRGMRNRNWPNHIPGGGLGRMLTGSGSKGGAGKGAGAGAGAGQGGKGQQPKGGSSGKGQTQPKGSSSKGSSSKGSSSKGSSSKGTKGTSSKSQQSKAASQLKAAQAAMLKAQKARAAQQKAAAAAYAKQVKTILAALTKLATAQQKARALALKVQAQQMMNAAKVAKLTPSPNAPLAGTRATRGRTISGNVGGAGLVQLAADSMTKASTPRLLGPNPLWSKPGFKLPDYIEHVASHLITTHGESKGIAMAVGIVRDWANGTPTGGMTKIKPSTIAAARKAISEWEALKAKAKSVKSTKHFTGGISDGELVVELARARRVRRPTETAVQVITGRRYRRYRQQGYTAASALARVAREAQRRQEATELAHQPGSVTVSSVNDGPRVTGNALSKGTRRVVDKSWDTTANRKRWAKEGVALPDGSFPIPSAAFVGKAARALGRTPASKRPRVKAHIRKRAKALGVTPPALGD